MVFKSLLFQKIICIGGSNGTVDLMQLFKSESNQKAAKPAQINLKEDIILLPYSSGTTGSPKVSESFLSIFLSKNSVFSFYALLILNEVSKISTLTLFLSFSKFIQFVNIHSFFRREILSNDSILGRYDKSPKLQ